MNDNCVVQMENEFDCLVVQLLSYNTNRVQIMNIYSLPGHSFFIPTTRIYFDADFHTKWKNSACAINLINMKFYVGSNDIHDKVIFTVDLFLKLNEEVQHLCNYIEKLKSWWISIDDTHRRSQFPQSNKRRT